MINPSQPIDQAALIAELESNKNDFPSYLHSLCRVAAGEIKRIQKELIVERAECMDQCRLNGMGAQREARLLSENQRMSALLSRLGHSQDDAHR